MEIKKNNADSDVVDKIINCQKIVNAVTEKNEHDTYVNMLKSMGTNVTNDFSYIKNRGAIVNYINFRLDIIDEYNAILESGDDCNNKNIIYYIYKFSYEVTKLYDIIYANKITF